MQIACRGTYAPFLCTAGCIAEADKMLPGHVLCGYRVCGYGLCGRIFNGCAAPEQSISVLCRYGLRGAGTKPQLYARNSFGPVHWNQKSRISPAFRGVVMVAAAFRLRFTAPRGLIFAVIVTAVPAVVSAGVAVPAAGCVGTVVLRVILLWFPDHVNDEPDDQNDRGDNPDPYAG